MNRFIKLIEQITRFFYRKKELLTEEKAIALADKHFLLDRHKRKYIVIKAIKGNFIVCMKQDIGKNEWRNKHFKNTKIRDIKKHIVYETI